jgi:hypothetical protein
MDRVTEAALSNNFEELGSAYAEDAEAVNPRPGDDHRPPGNRDLFCGLIDRLPGRRV